VTRPILPCRCIAGGRRTPHNWFEAAAAPPTYHARVIVRTRARTRTREKATMTSTPRPRYNVVVVHWLYVQYIQHARLAASITSRPPRATIIIVLHYTAGASAKHSNIILYHYSLYRLYSVVARTYGYKLKLAQPLTHMGVCVCVFQCLYT